MLRFDLNVSILLKEYPFLERFDQAARLGFGAVEFWWPTESDPRMVARQIRDAQLAVALFNLDAGNMPAGDRGLLNDPAREPQLRANVPVALELAQAIGCTRINALLGKWRTGEERASQLERVRGNLRWIAEQARAAGVTVLVEAINCWDNGPYIAARTAEALDLIESVGAPNIQLQYDVYHMQRMEGEIVPTLRRVIDRIGHIQIADAPGRHQPGTGELSYRFILAALEQLDYAGYVGLEYNPLGATQDSLGWLPRERRKTASAADLVL